MSTKYLFFAALPLLAITCFTSYGQKASVLLGDEIKVSSRRGTLEDIVGHDPTGFFALRSNSRTEVMLEHYDNNLKAITQTELDLGRKKEEREYERILDVNEQLYLFSSLNQSKTRKNVLYVQRIDKKTLKPEAQVRQVADIDYTRRNNDGNYGFYISPNKLYALVYYNLPFDKGDPEKFAFTVMDKNMEVVWHKDVKLPYNDELFNVEDFIVDNQGNVHILGIVYRGKPKEKVKGLPNYDYHVLSYTSQGNVFKEYTVNLKKNFITDMQITVRDNGEIIGSGFYSENGTTTIKGTFFVALDNRSKSIGKEHVQEFNEQFLTEFMSERKARKGKELYKYDLKRFQLRDDGGAVLIAEQYYITVVQQAPRMSGNGLMTSGSTTYLYTYNDIIVTSINPNGTIEWTRKIPKRQVTSNDGGYFSSFTYAVLKDKMYFVFNDHNRNLTNPNAENPANFNGATKESVVVLVSIDSKGNMDKQPLMNRRSIEVTIRPKVSEQITDNELILFGERKRDHKFAKVTLGASL
jgi:hypothetical protein